MLHFIKKYYFETALLFLGTFASFASGLVFEKNLLIGLVLLFISIMLQIFREKKQSNIKGEGVKKISLSKEAPLKPEEGDIWMEIK